jgi:8-oxo-dGTP pyrophosphatase MutT (NUDIX family)
VSDSIADIVQAGVIPFRPTADGGLEVLLIRRPAKPKWGIPKGMVNSGQSLREAAEQEAIEESGAAGEMSAHPIGTYRYRKRGSRRLVHVFLLRVIQTIDDYPERGIRVRDWFPIDACQSVVRHQGVASLIRAIPRHIRLSPSGRVAFLPDRP